MVIIHQTDRGQELDGMKLLAGGKECDIMLTNYEEIFARKLAVYGDVKVPPPSYEEAVDLAIESGVELSALDMDEDRYTTVFCDNISSLELMRYSLRLQRMRKKRFKECTAEEFVLAWDRRMNKTKGFRAVEEAREKHMAKRLKKLAKGKERVLAVLDLERLEGVLEALDTVSPGG